MVAVRYEDGSGGQAAKREKGFKLRSKQMKENQAVTG